MGDFQLAVATRAQSGVTVLWEHVRDVRDRRRHWSEILAWSTSDTSDAPRSACRLLFSLLNIGRVLARALALLGRKAPADQKRIAIAQATAGIRYASAVLFSGQRNSYGSCRQKRLCRFR